MGFEGLCYMNREEGFGDDFGHLLNDIIQDSVWIADMHGEILEVNERLYGLLYFSKDEMVGKNILELYPKERQAEMERLFLFHPRNNRASMLLTFLRKDGVEIPVEGIFSWGKRKGRTVLYGFHRTSWETHVSDRGWIEKKDNRENDAKLRDHFSKVTADKNPSFLQTPERMASLLDFYKRVFTKSERKEFLWQAQRSIQQILEMDVMGIHVLDKDSQEWSFHPGVGVSDKILKACKQQKFKQRMKRRMMNRSAATLMPVERHPEGKMKTLLKTEGLMIVGRCPLVFDNQFFGILHFGYKSLRRFSLHEKALILELCSHLALRLHHWRLHAKLKNHLKHMRHKDEKLEAFFKLSTDLICIMDAEGRVQRVSAEFVKRLGWKEEELLQKSLIGWIHPEDRSAAMKATAILAAGKEINGMLNRFICKDKTYRWLQWNARYNTKSRALVASARDMTQYLEMKEKEKQLQQTMQLDMLKTEFFANISHEFRTPLNIILGNLQLMQRALGKVEEPAVSMDDLPKLLRYIKSLRQNTFRLLRLINNLIDITKIDAGFFELNLVNCNIIQIIEEITLSVANYMEGKNIKLTFDTALEEKFMACDPDKIERIMLNLLSNAVKFTEKQGGIWVNICSKQDSILVSVKDTGIGIAPDKKEVIFERFRQIDKSLNRKCEGSGIGLSLVKSLLELHGGRIWVKSKMGEGSEFVFELPSIVYQEEKREISDSFKVPEWKSQIQKINIEFSDIYD